MWDLIGHDAAIAALDRMNRAGSVPQALLISGAAGVGKQRLGVELAKALNCTESDPPGQHCIHCRQIDAGSHPDVSLIEPLDGKENIVIQQARTLRDAASLRPYQGRVKVYIIAGAETLTAQAADALLKSLEDPQPRVCFVLTAVDVDALPATVVSRCRVMTLQALPASTIVGALQTRGTSAAAAADIARLALGSIGWALRAAQQPKLIAQRTEAIERLSRTLDLPIRERMQLIEALTADRKDRAAVRGQLEILVLLARDALLLGAGLPAVLANRAQADVLRAQIDRLGVERLLKYVERLRLTMRRIDQNVDPRLALEALLVSSP